MKISFNWLKDYVRVKGSAESLSDLLTMAGLNVEKSERVKNDTVLEIEVTTNRPDWLSHIGVAREIHAVSGSRLVLPSIQRKAHGKTEKTFPISIPHPEFCPYYSAVLLEDVKSGEAPDFMKARLEACGIRSINLIVDITNYVLLECGQPLHAFDADRLHGNKISARRARTGEKIAAIDGKIYELVSDDIVIADARGPIAIGGVMGGKESEVSESTQNVLLESAYFAPSRIRQTARRLGLGSESSYRFERKVDPLGVDWARERAVDLIAKYALVGRISSVFKAGKPPLKSISISLETSEVKRILGVEIPQSKIKSDLSRLGLRVSGKGKKWMVHVPSSRSDLTQPIDLIEEVARLYGYDRIPETLPIVKPIEPRIEPLLDLEEKVRNFCVGFGFFEAVSFSLVEPVPFDQLGLYSNERVKLINPQNKELNLMRPSLLSGLIQAVRRNLYVGETDVRLFEIGNRYLEMGTRLPKEERLLSLVISGEGRLHWLEKRRPANFYDLKGCVEEFLNQLGIHSWEEHPANSIFQAGEGISLTLKGEVLGSYGTISDRARKVYDLEKPAFYAELSLEKILPCIQPRGLTREIPKFPASPRDLTVIVNENVKAEAIIDQIRKRVHDLTTKIEIFDFFKGGPIPKGKKSLSFRIFYQAKDRTLQNEEVNALHFSMIDVLKQSFGAELPKGKESNA
ncbi:MAG: phenylalanine--tRNA ligase subunit beta [Candidatus Omnitrophica bacterium]|nr:phenylalanine--tRNA ligase subunit beta [Candidatus Omnitrophota bacterium]